MENSPMRRKRKIRMYQLQPGTRVSLFEDFFLPLLSLPLVRLWNLNGKERPVRTKCKARPVNKKSFMTTCPFS